jgi:DNA-directed RNA polymerase subunit alpha
LIINHVQTPTFGADIVLSENIDIEDFLKLRHLSFQCISERRELADLYHNFESRAAGLSDSNLRKLALSWGLGIKFDDSELNNIDHPLAYMIKCKIEKEAGHLDKAMDYCQKAAKAASTEKSCVLPQIELSLAQKNLEQAATFLQELEKDFADCSEYLYLKGRYQELDGDYLSAFENYEKAIEKDENNYNAIFHMAKLADLRGDTEEAINLYNKISPGRTHAFINSALNLALIYEDEGQYQKAIDYCKEVLEQDPTSHRAKLYLKDIEESMQMYYSPEDAKESERIEAILRVPVSDFELSVRSRNCLSKMNIKNLGDLVRKTEAEMLAYKNFGETSLREIKEMLVSRNLRLGMIREDGSHAPIFHATKPKPGGNGLEDASIDELELSVRSRKCMERLGIQTIGQLTSMSEADLVSAKNFGRVSLQEIKAKMMEKGLSLK